MWNNLSRFLFVACLIAVGVAAYLYWGYGEELRLSNQEMEAKYQEVTLENTRLKENVTYLTSQLDEEVAKLSKEKEEGIAKARATQAEMVKSLEKEVELGQIKITHWRIACLSTSSTRSFSRRVKTKSRKRENAC